MRDPQRSRQVERIERTVNLLHALVDELYRGAGGGSRTCRSRRDRSTSTISTTRT